MERLSQEIKTSLDRRGEHATCDGLVPDMKTMKSETDFAARRVTLQLDDLAGFLKQNDDYADRLDFANVRSWIDSTRKSTDDLKSRVSRAAEGVQDVLVKVNVEGGDWDSTHLTAAAGDLFAFEASGTWSVGGWAGSCGPGGMGGYEGYSVVREKPHGCLLVRVGETVVSAGNKGGIINVAAPGELIAMRCNDKKATDNAGALSLRVVLVPMSALARQ